MSQVWDAYTVVIFTESWPDGIGPVSWFMLKSLNCITSIRTGDPNNNAKRKHEDKKAAFSF